MDMEGRKVGGGEKDALLPRKWEEAATVAGFALGFGALPLCLRTLGGWGWGEVFKVSKGSGSEVLTAGKKGPTRILASQLSLSVGRAEGLLPLLPPKPQ